MRITRHMAAERLGDYLRHRTSLQQLVEWAEAQMMEGDFESSVVRDAVGRMGLADVREFGIAWDDCQQLLRQLGFEAHVQIEAAHP